MNRYYVWVLDYTQRNPLKAVAIAFAKGLVIAALLLGCSSSAKAQDIYIEDIDLMFSTFTVGVTDLGNDLNVSSFTLWISEPDWDSTEVVLNDEEILPFLDTHLYDIEFEIEPGEEYTFALPMSWVNWLRHGIFSGQNNQAVIGVWGMNDYIPWIYGENSDWPYDTDGTANNYQFVEAIVTENLVEVPSETVYVYVDSTSGIEVATVTVPTVVNTSEDLTFLSQVRWNRLALLYTILQVRLYGLHLIQMISILTMSQQEYTCTRYR